MFNHVEKLNGVAHTPQLHSSMPEKPGSIGRGCPKLNPTALGPQANHYADQTVVSKRAQTGEALSAPPTRGFDDAFKNMLIAAEEHSGAAQ